MTSCSLYLCKPGRPDPISQMPGWSNRMDDMAGSLGVDWEPSIRYIRLNGWSYLSHWVIKLKVREREGVSE